MPEADHGPIEAEQDAYLAHPSKMRRSDRLKLIGAIALVVAVLAAAAGIFSRSMDSQKVKSWTNAQATPTVSLAKLTSPLDKGGALVLPGQLAAFNNAAVRARVPGYLKKWYVDIGARVKTGQLLAEIETPDLDQQIVQARANLASAMANQNLAQTTNARWVKLLTDQAVAKQEADEKAGDLAAKTELANAARAQVNQLMATKAFARITAPFDGVITNRNAQQGQLVAAAATDPSLFEIADDSKLRVYVQVPQVYISSIRPGAEAQLALPDYPGRTFKAMLANTSEAVSGQSGTLTAELQLDNPEHALKPGEYVQASFRVAAAADVIVVPASALAYRSGGMMVGVVEPDSKVHLQKVEISRDLGSTVEISAGLKLADKVVDNPSDTLAEGDTVTIAAPPAAPAQPAVAAK